MVEGIGASPGIAMGKAFVIPSWEWEFPDKLIDVTDLTLEFERLYDGIRCSKTEIEHIKHDISTLIGEEESTIFDAHLAILEDPIFMNEVQTIMQRGSKAAEVAVKEAIDKFVGMFDLLDDQYMKERALDIKDVGNRLLKHLLGHLDEPELPRDQPFILVAKELAPSQLANFDLTEALGLVTMLGGKTSHAAIMARAMGIPYVLGLEDEQMSRTIQTGDYVIIDGDEGIVHVNPSAEVIERYTVRKQQWQQMRDKLQEIAHLPAQTVDGLSMRLAANISTTKELDQVVKNGASGVGLFRTEFLYMDREGLPDEDEQFEVYKQVAQRMGTKPVIIRTLDIGGDKNLHYIELPEEENPFLGYRAIRISLDREDLFKTQLRAILRSSHYGAVKIMYPMISSLNEVRQANAILETAKRELAAEQVPFNDQIEVGIMIEVPAAAVIADLLAKEVQFFSIGTNDLVQYVLAVDRMNDAIAHLYDPFHPAVLRMLKYTVDAAIRSGIPVSVCGELAGDVRALPIWLGLGITDLSMSIQSILRVKSAVLESSREQASALIHQLFGCATSEAIIDLLDSFNKKDNLAKSTCGGNNNGTSAI